MVADSGTVFHMVMPPVADRLRQAACAITAAAMATPNPHPTRGRRELVSWRLYRALTGVALLALVLAALAVQHPDAPSPPDQPVTVSGASVISAAQDQSTAEHTAAGGCCAAGSAGELAGATDMSEKLTNFDPKPELVQFASNLAWRSQPVPMINVIAYKPGTQAGIIAVIAHRDGGGVQPPIGSGLLVALGKALNPLKLRRGVVLVSTDGGTTGGQGADQFARTWPQADQIVSAITIDSIAGPPGATLRLATRTVTPRGTSPTLVAALRQSTALVGGADPDLPSTINQLTGYAIPYAPTEQSPLLAHQVPAVSVSAGGAPTPQLFKQVNSKQVGQAASAIATLVVTLDTAPSIDRGGPPVVFAGVSVVRGWLLELALMLLLLPCLACVLVLVGKARRRRVSLAPGMWALGWRLSTWLVGLLTIWLLTLAPGDLLPSISAPPLPYRTGVTTSGIVIVILVTAAYWRFVSGPRLRGSGGLWRRPHDWSYHWAFGSDAGGRAARSDQPVHVDRDPARCARLVVDRCCRASGAAGNGAAVRARIPGLGAGARRVVVRPGSGIADAAGGAGDDRQRVPVPRRHLLRRHRRRRGLPDRSPGTGPLRPGE